MRRPERGTGRGDGAREGEGQNGGEHKHEGDKGNTPKWTEEVGTVEGALPTGAAGDAIGSARWR